MLSEAGANNGSLLVQGLMRLGSTHIPAETLVRFWIGALSPAGPGQGSTR
jgi:hypothetical protein